MKKVKLSEPQSRAFYSQASSTAVVAGFGSGKTTTGVVNVFDKLIRYSGIPQGYAAPTYGDIKSIWYPAVEEHCLKHNIKFHIHKSDHVINVFGVGKIVCRSLSNPDKIVGFEVGDFHLDELDILPTEQALLAWRKCKARCRKKYPKKRLMLPFGEKSATKVRKRNQMYLYTTPEGFKATYEMFVRNPLKRSQIIQMSTYSNLHNLPDDYIEELRSNYPENLIEAYINGNFVNLKSLPVWTGFDRVLNCSFETVGHFDSLIVGMDFNVNRGCAVVYVQRSNGLHAVDEIVNTYDTNRTIEILKERYPKHSITVIPDASGDNRKSTNATTSDLALLRQAGFIVRNNKKNPNIKDRVMSTNALFCNALGVRRLFVNINRCPVFTESLEQQAYDVNGLPEKGEGKYDDITDAGSYPIAYMFPIKKESVLLRRLKGF